MYNTYFNMTKYNLMDGHFLINGKLILNYLSVYYTSINVKVINKNVV